MPYSSLFYHIVWATKDRLPLIEPRFEERLHKMIAAKGVDLGAQIYAIGGIEDHIHVVASVAPTIAPTDFIRQLKGSSSRFINQELNVAFSWQAEYGVMSFGRKALPDVVQYVKNQRKHHTDKTHNEYLERIT